MNILLLGANERAAYSIAKSAYNNGHKITILNDEPHAIKYSRFVNEFICITHSFEKETTQAVEEITNCLQQNKYDALIPVHDTALTICYQFKNELSALTKTYFVNEPSVHIFCMNKYALWQKCNELNIPVPASILIQSLDDIILLKDIKFPCIAKPVSSKVYKNGKIFSYTVKKIDTEDELIDFIREKIETVAVMVQEVLADGYGTGYNFLSVKGKVLTAYAHQRINEAWGGGQSTYRKTINPSEYGLETYSKKIIESIGWTGIAMIEYRIINGIPYIMEINGRGWGSIELGVFAGCNLSADMINVLSNNAFPVPFNFKNTRYARNIFNEIIWVMQSKSPVVFVKWLWSLKSSFRKDHIIEDSIFRDFRFRIRYANNVIATQFAKLIKKIKCKLISPSIAIASSTNIDAKKNIVFICKGNINRSAFAQAYLNNKNLGFHTSDCGTVFEENRLSPINAIKAASGFGVDLQAHCSKYLTKEAIANSDIFIVMDRTNYDDLLALKVSPDKIFLLNASGINDPYGKPVQAFEAVFKKIASSIDDVFE